MLSTLFRCALLCCCLAFSAEAQQSLEKKIIEGQEHLEAGSWEACEQSLKDCFALLDSDTTKRLLQYKVYETELYFAFSTSDYDRAIKANGQLLRISKERRDSLAISTHYNDFGVLFTIKKDIAQSIKYYRKALQIYLSQDDTTEQQIRNRALCHYNLGVALYNKYEHRQALLHYQKALSVLTKLPEASIREDLISIHQGLVEAYQKLEQIDSAFYYLRKNQGLHRYSDYEKDGTLESYGLAHFRREEFRIAQRYFQQSLNLRLEEYGERHPWVAKAWYWLALCAHKRKQAQTAATYAQNGLKALSPSFASDNWQQNPSISEVFELPKLIDLLHLKTKALQQMGKPQGANAQICSQLSLAAIDSLRSGYQAEDSKRLLLTDSKAVWETALEIVYQNYREQPSKAYARIAFRIMERGKAALLREALSKSKANSFGGVPDALLETEQALERDAAFYKQMLLRAQRNTLTRQYEVYQNYLTNTQLRLDSLRLTIEQQYPRYHHLKYETQLVRLQELQSELDAQSMMQVFFEGDSAVYSLCISQQEVWLEKHPLPGNYATLLQELERSITDVKFAINFTKQAYQNFTKYSLELYNWLLRNNLKRRPASVDRLILIPDGQLSYLPFELLLPVAAPQHHFRFQELPYLLYQYAISYDYSATLWLENQRRASQTVAAKELLALAYSPNAQRPFSNAQREPLIPLPGAIAELRYLEKQFEGSFWVNEQATESALMQEIGQYKVLHFAMHGLMNKAQPAYSSLALYPEADSLDAGHLYAYEIQQLRLQAQLVVLSACETGYGQYQAGEGLMSLGRSFMYAGTPSLLLSMWQVGDQSSVGLISDFYQQLANGVPKDRALQQAKIRHLQQSNMLTGHPFQWASFVQFGARTPIDLPQKQNVPWLWLGTGVLLLALAVFSWWKTVGFGKKKP